MPTLNELLHAASRTFALGIDLLPEPLRTEVEVAYLLLRVSDYLEDNVTMGPERKVRLLERWADTLAGEAPLDPLEDALRAHREDTPDALVARNAGRVVDALRGLPPEARRVVARHVRDSTLGMARWADRGPAIEGEPELDDYMHEVAGRVGWLLTELFSLHVPEVARRRGEMMALGREFGLALQTVNVIRGLHADWQRGWIYVPRSFLEGAAGEPAELFRDGTASPELEAAVLGRMVRKADRHLVAARRYVERLPRRQHGIRLFCLLPYFFAVRTLAVSRGNPRVFREEVKIPRSDVARIARAARLLGWSNAWVTWYARRLDGRQAERVRGTDLEEGSGRGRGGRDESPREGHA